MSELKRNKTEIRKERKELSAELLSEILESEVDPDSIPKGDMPGDKIRINENHIRKARFILPILTGLLVPIMNEHPWRRAVVAVCGGSGVGKSETASLLSYYLNRMGVGSYTLSGDNYPHRIPKYNDAERLRIFRQSGIRGLIAGGRYDEGVKSALKELQRNEKDSDPGYVKDHPWLSIYQDAGKCGLRSYLGTRSEIDFVGINEIISQFKNGRDKIYLKRMGREETELWYDLTDLSSVNTLIIEWTHGNSFDLSGVDIPILLNSTPQETLEHRRTRNRDGGTDSPFTMMVLAIEQDLLISQASRAKLIVSKNCELLSYGEFMRIMRQDPATGGEANG